MAQQASDTTPVNIVGDRVALGPLRRDLIPLYQRWRNNFAVQRTSGNLPKPVTLADRTRWFENAPAPDAHWFTIYIRESMRPIGTTHLSDVSFRWRSAEFGIEIGENDARGLGYGTETTRLMLEYAFTALGLNNVMLRVAEYNPAARRAYTKAGFREMGRRRQADIANGKIYDLIYMDCIASEFEYSYMAHIFQPDTER